MLPRLIGRSKAMELAFTAEPIDAQEAWRIGLVSEVTADDALAARTSEMARRIARHPAARCACISACYGMRNSIPWQPTWMWWQHFRRSHMLPMSTCERCAM